MKNTTLIKSHTMKNLQTTVYNKLTNSYARDNHVLIHWTGRGKTDEDAFITLVKILTENRLLFGNKTIVKKSTRRKEPSDILNSNTPINDCRHNMICFTDNSVEDSLDLLEKYKKFGIAFKKEELIELGCAPVHYIPNIQYSNFITWVSSLFNTLSDENEYVSWILAHSQPFSDEISKNKTCFWSRPLKIGLSYRGLNKGTKTCVNLY